MLKKITVVNHRNDRLTMELAKPEMSGFMITNIEGIGPGKANLATSEVATSDGSFITSARMPKRNIVFTIKYLAAPDIETVRQKSYQYFPLKQEITLIFYTDNRTSQIKGVVESNEPVIFSSIEYTQISIICADPYFYAIDKTFYQFSNLESLFYFPFCNASLIENKIVFGSISNNDVQNIEYEGDAETGVVITLHALGEVHNITIYNIVTREKMKIDTDKLEEMTGYPLITSDDLTISTLKGNKYVQLLRGGEYINVLNCLDKHTNWFQLTNGDNLFSYVAETGGENLEVNIQSQIVYMGV